MFFPSFFLNLCDPHGFEVNVKTTIQQKRVDESQEVQAVWSELNTKPLLYLIICSPALIRLTFISTLKAAAQCSRD